MDGHENAELIIANEVELAELVDNSRRKSAFVIKDPDFEAKLIEILEGSSSPLDSRQVHAAYESKSSRKVSRRTIKHYVGGLVGKGQIQLSETQIPGKRQKSLAYTAA